MPTTATRPRNKVMVKPELEALTSLQCYEILVDAMPGFSRADREVLEKECPVLMQFVDALKTRAFPITHYKFKAAAQATISYSAIASKENLENNIRRDTEANALEDAGYFLEINDKLNLLDATAVETYQNLEWFYKNRAQKDDVVEINLRNGMQSLEAAIASSSPLAKEIATSLKYSISAITRRTASLQNFQLFAGAPAAVRN